ATPTQSPLATNAPATAGPTGGISPGAALARRLTDGLGEIRRMGWRIWIPLAIILIYVILTRNFIALFIGFAIAWLIRRYADRLDRVLLPIWPLRNRLPRRSRKVLAWVAPLIVSFIISGWLIKFFDWLPLIGPDASVFTFTALIAALIAYPLIRESELAQGK
ncbi:MAG: hypothetical protein WCF84_08660, partial [Anaerolineae bacterium]